MDKSSQKRKRGRRGRRRPKPLYERSSPKYFGQGFEITTRDLRDILETLDDLSRQMSVSEEVKLKVDFALSEVLADSERSSFHKSLVLKICQRMAVADYEAILFKLELVHDAITVSYTHLTLPTKRIV